jgi:hypothetical protein
MGLRTWLGLKKRPPAPSSLIRIFRTDPMTYTPFAVNQRIPKAFKRIGVTYVDDPERADIIIARRPRHLPPYGDLDRRLLLWTHEPRYAFIEGSINRIDGVRNPVHLITAYNGMVYADHYYYGPRRTVDFDERMRAFRSKPRRAVMLATYRSRDTSLIRNGVDVDLNKRRQELALALHRDGKCDLYGRDWPSEVRIVEESRGDGWQGAKQDILARYKINIAFENTVIPYYITEKLWDALEGACLPVYEGANNRIYDVMPRGCFIEAAGKSIDELKDQVLSMPDDEMADRYEVALRRFNELAADHPRVASRRRCVERTAQFLTEIVK